MSTWYMCADNSNKITDLPDHIRIVDVYEEDKSIHDISRDPWLECDGTFLVYDGNSYLHADINADGIIGGFTRYGRNEPFLYDYLTNVYSEHEYWYDEKEGVYRDTFNNLI